MAKLICKQCGRVNVARDYQCSCGNIVDTAFLEAPEKVEDLHTEFPHKSGSPDAEAIAMQQRASTEKPEFPKKEVISQKPSEDEKVKLEEQAVKEPKKTFSPYDLNKDGKVDSKDSSLAGKVLSNAKKNKRKFAKKRK